MAMLLGSSLHVASTLPAIWALAILVMQGRPSAVSVLVAAIISADLARLTGRRAVQQPVSGGQTDLVRPPARTMHPSVRVDRLAESRKPPRNLFNLPFPFACRSNTRGSVSARWRVTVSATTRSSGLARGDTQCLLWLNTMPVRGCLLRRAYTGYVLPHAGLGTCGGGGRTQSRNQGKLPPPSGFYSAGV